MTEAQKRANERLLKLPSNRLVDGELRIAGIFSWKLFNLLAKIDSVGSINRAAKEAGLSYKGAWELLERANNVSPRLLVSTAIGGKHGGGSELTEAGRSLLRLYAKIQKQHERFLDQLNQELATNSEFNFLIRRNFMKASARNQFFGVVGDLHEGSINAEIVIELKGGDKLEAAITVDSLKNLGITKGTEVVALVKAPQVMIVTDLGSYRLSARNQLAGKVIRLEKGAVNTDVVVQLPGGNTVYSMVTNESVEDLGLSEGKEVVAAFKANAVILAVAS